MWPLFFYSRIAKRFPEMKLNLAFYSLVLVLTSIEGIAHFAFDLDNVWTEGIRYLRIACLLGAVLTSILHAAKKKKEKSDANRGT
jgi:hypothetical protein